MIAVYREPRLSTSRRGVEKRVSRLLAQTGEYLRKCSARSRWYSSLGDYYLTNAASGFVVSTHQDLEDLARELGVIAEGQTIADE